MAKSGGKKQQGGGDPPGRFPGSQRLTIQQALDLAVRHHGAGRLAEAEGIYRQVLVADPDQPQAQHLLGVIAHQSGRNDQARDLIGKALAVKPDYAEAHNNLGLTLQALGQVDAARACFEKAIALKPDIDGAHANLGSALEAMGLLDEAAANYRRAIVLDPADAELPAALGNVQDRLGLLDDAAANYRKALQIDPGLFGVHANLGNVLERLGLLDAALVSYRQAIAIAPDYAEAHSNLGSVLEQQGLSDEAIASYRRALAIDPGLCGTHTNLGNVLKSLGLLEEAVTSHRRAIALKPDYAEAHTNLGSALRELGRLDESAACYREALRFNPGLAEAHSNLGITLTALRQFDEAIARYERAMAIRPDHHRTLNNYLYTLLYHPRIKNPELFATYRRLVRDYGAHENIGPGRVRRASPADPKRLRVGYLSSDFHDHPLGHNVMPLIANHDHERFEIFCYAKLTRQDGITEQFRRHADHWRAIDGLTDAQAAERISDDGIHVMVYLGGHFDGNRPWVARHRPAPVQASLYGGTTTALDEMDFWLTDKILHPDDTTEQFSEKLFHLRQQFVYPIPENAPVVSSLPADDNDFITFASFNKPSKMNDAVLDLWSRILLAVPDARLILKFRNHLETPSLSAEMLDRFARNGVSPERVSLVSSTDKFRDHLGLYHRADIALDTFPFAGATTTFQALWMGVPVVSLMGERFISRMGGSLSVHAGLDFLAADTPDAYVETAVVLAGDWPRLRELRSTLRQRIAASPLCDGPAFARNVEKAFRAMWATRAAGDGKSKKRR